MSDRTAVQDEMPGATSAREEDHNGYVTVRDNPILRAGVFQYKGAVLSKDADPGKIYNVYRPIEEITKPETLKSLCGLPLIDEHEMVGGKYPRGPEEKGVHGATGETAVVRGNDVLTNIRMFSRTLKHLLEMGKKGLSLGYNCVFEKSSGVFDGTTYDYIQRNILGNHLALVTQGRNGTDVLDQHFAFDHFDLALDTGETTMADEKKADVKDEGEEGKEKSEMTLSELTAGFQKLLPLLETVEKLKAASTTKADAAGEIALDGEDDKKDDKKDKAEDGDDKDEKKDKAMDAAEVRGIVSAELGSLRSSLSKSVMTEVTERNALAKQLEPLVGTFAHDHMDATEVAAYGCDKLGLKPAKGQERAALTGFFAGAKKGAENTRSYAMDSAGHGTVPKPKADGKLAGRLNGTSAA